MPKAGGKSSSRDIKVSKAAVDEAFKALSNWGRWGKDDEIGTLNHITPAEIVAAAKLIRRGKVFALGIPLGNKGPQRGLFGKRWNPIHTMLATGTDALAGRQSGLLYADDALNMPIQSATHWDSLGHIFYHDKMYNGHHASAVDSNGLSKLGIEHAKDKLVGRGVLLDIARWKKVDTLKDGEGISNDDLDACAAAQKVEIRKGDFVHRAHRPDGSLPQAQGVGRLRRRRRAGPQVRELLLAAGQAGRRRVLGHLGRGGAAQRDQGRQPALALGGDPGHGPLHGRDVRPQGAGRGLRHGQDLRVLLLRRAAHDPRRHRLADQSAGHQVRGRRAAMKLGFFTMPIHPLDKDWRKSLREDREAFILADKLGFTEGYVGEHATDKAENITSCAMFIASLIDATKRIKLGTGTINMPNNHPAAIAANIAMLDHMLDGRFIFGISPGGLLSDAEVFGNLDADRNAMFLECDQPGAGDLGRRAALQHQGQILERSRSSGS